MKAVHIIASALLGIGGLNWGAVGLGLLMGGQNWNVVHSLLGFSMTLEAAVYALVGLSAVWLLLTHRRACRDCRA
jgi:uncharacterized membrane protein YuzA (DUF378 family)